MSSALLAVPRARSLPLGGQDGVVGRAIDVWNKWGIRKQLTAVAVFLVAMPLCLGIVLFANLLTRSLSQSLVTSTSDQAHHIAQHIAQNGAKGLSEGIQLDDGYRAQVIDSFGRITWSSSIKYRQPISTAHPAPGEVIVVGAQSWWGPGDDEKTDLVVSTGTLAGLQPYTVHVTTSQQSINSAVKVTTGLLLAAVPLVMLATGLVSWWVAGRALRPVDRMIDQVSRITSSTLDDRVPLPAAEDEIHSLAATMNAMLGRLETASVSQKQFVSDASHELRSPLASLSGALEIASREDRIETWREMSPLMVAEAERMHHLVQSLLTLSRNDAASLNLHLSETDLDDLAWDEASRMRAVGTKSVRTEIVPVRLSADPMMLRQVLRNLCDNALRHARETVLVHVGTSDGSAVLRVEDDGNGIAPADRPTIFDRFVRLEESRNRDEGGSGLGLAIVAQIVHAHGGTVQVVDSPLGGACFEVRLPLATSRRT